MPKSKRARIAAVTPRAVSRRRILSQDSGRLERNFDAGFASSLSLKEKQIQQSYRPIIGIHKWFARRPGSLFRSLLLAEFEASEPLSTSYWRSHEFTGVIADPFMGGGMPIYEANRLGFHVVGADINPMSFWIVRQALSGLDLDSFRAEAASVASEVEREIADLYTTECIRCGGTAAVKYFVWVKIATCPNCARAVDLFPGYLLAEDVRHPKNVVVCSRCGGLSEFANTPTSDSPGSCRGCGRRVVVEGPARRQSVRCPSCDTSISYGKGRPSKPPAHRMWAIEYRCESCKPNHVGRFFKTPDAGDLERLASVPRRLTNAGRLPIPNEKIPSGDETDRLLRWGYVRYRELFNDRQLLGLGLLLRRIKAVRSKELRYALMTVFSDSLRYQNMLCRYDTYALKCQDIFSVHGFPVSLVQCENSLLGIPHVGSGSFRHFVEKYARAKEYCVTPFETASLGGRRKIIPIRGERIAATLRVRFPKGKRRQALLRAASAVTVPLQPYSLDGVFTDPPYFDNVQYAELMDFCYVWLRSGLRREFPEFRSETTRAPDELTGNVTQGKGLEHFTEGLSAVFRHYSGALKHGAPFVFTYHHNDPEAYVPIVVSILDAGLACTATLPAAAEMGASLHIAGTNSSVFDSVFVCRRPVRKRAKTSPKGTHRNLRDALSSDRAALAGAGVRLSAGDRRCLAAGHIARFAVEALLDAWNSQRALADRMALASKTLKRLTATADLPRVLAEQVDVPKREEIESETSWLPGLLAEA